MDFYKYLAAAIAAGGVGLGGYYYFSPPPPPLTQKLNSVLNDQRSLQSQIEDCSHKIGETAVSFPAVPNYNCEYGGQTVTGKTIKSASDTSACYDARIRNGLVAIEDLKNKLSYCTNALSRIDQIKSTISTLDAQSKSMQADLQACKKNLGQDSYSYSAALLFSGITDVDCSKSNTVVTGGYFCTLNKLNKLQSISGSLEAQLKSCNEQIESQVADSMAAYDQFLANLKYFQGIKDSLTQCESEKNTSSIYSSSVAGNADISKYSKKDLILAASQDLLSRAAQLKNQVAVCQQSVAVVATSPTRDVSSVSTTPKLPAYKYYNFRGYDRFNIEK